MTVDDAKKYVENVLFLFYQTKKFDEMVTGEFQGKKCNLYRLDDGTSNETYYVNENNDLLGVSIVTADPSSTDYYNLTMVFNIKYDEIPLSEFALTKEVCAVCADEAYVAPTERLCNSPSSGVTPASSGKKGSSSDATTTKAVVAMVLLSLAVALF